jgi:proline iminopeptidase
MSDQLNGRDGVIELLKALRHIPGESAIEEGLNVVIGGVDQYLEIRGKDREKPLLLFVHGGPGSPELPTSWLYQSAWEEYFVVVQWDQRGCGKSFPDDLEAFNADLITVDRMVDDGEELVDYLLTRFGRKKLFVVGHSWGTVIGLGLARNRPEALFAYVGIGQVVNSMQSESLSYGFVKKRALATGNAEAIAELAAIAPYPPTPENFSVGAVLTERKWVNYFGGMVHGQPGAAHLDNAKVLAPSYTSEDLERAPHSVSSVMQLLPPMLTYDVTALTELSCPMFLFAGRFDFATSSQAATNWFEKLHAPRKQFVWFENSAHMIQYEEPGKVFLTLVNDVLPLA